MKIEEVRAVVELYRCSQSSSHHTAASPEQIHKLMKLAARVRRLTFETNGTHKLTNTQVRAFDRALRDADFLAREIGAKGVNIKPKAGYATLLVLWGHCDPTEL